MTKNIAGAYVCSMRIEFNLRHNVQYSIVFERFSVNSRKRIKTVVWTGSDRCVLDNNENAKFWKRISVDGTYRFYCQFSSWRGWVCLLSGGRGADEDGRPGVWLSLIRCSKTQLLNDVSWLYSSLSLLLGWAKTPYWKRHCYYCVPRLGWKDFFQSASDQVQICPYPFWT